MPGIFCRHFSADVVESFFFSSFLEKPFKLFAGTFRYVSKYFFKLLVVVPLIIFWVFLMLLECHQTFMQCSRQATFPLKKSSNLFNKYFKEI
jgi:hypothetical protein